MSLRIGIGGAVIEAQLDDKAGEILCALAGPVGSLLLLLLLRHYPKLAICAGIQGAFNLLPIYPLDGGRILQCCLELFCPQKADRISFITELSVMSAIAVLAAVGTFLFSLGAMPLLIAVAVIIKAVLRKRPCKQGENRVQ